MAEGDQTGALFAAAGFVFLGGGRWYCAACGFAFLRPWPTQGNPRPKRETRPRYVLRHREKSALRALSHAALVHDYSMQPKGDPR